ncbi:hypothetical protein [Natronobacterium lacisalsi]|uniref:hypothetical protein n=1 Tax=Natronobacterium lacisalsi TaxID=229731 RepID=UPI00187DAEB4|nr:hypothetical protein [Halobiforma lacisalsi]
MGLVKKGIHTYRENGLLNTVEKSTSFVRSHPHYLHHAITNLAFRLRYGEGTDVMAKDWDNLLLLDACRYDIFSDENNIDGDLQSVISHGSSSLEFIEGNFANEDLHDTVYVTANTYYDVLDDDVFHAVITCFDHWDEELMTVPPGGVVETALKAHEQYPQKRLIIHFMQPHAPYIGEKGRELRERLSRQINITGMTLERAQKDSRTETENSPRTVQTIEAPTVDGLDVSDTEIREAYTENLNVVLSHVKELLPQLTGKTVISADHGELLGERVFPLYRKRYEHPTYLHVPELCIVPWLVIEGDERKYVNPEPPERYDSMRQEELDEKLEALGYR